ncbi:MAG: hypothetical protein Aurels2KO_21570 [Aureliella sp.]
MNIARKNYMTNELADLIHLGVELFSTGRRPSRCWRDLRFPRERAIQNAISDRQLMAKKIRGR